MRIRLHILFSALTYELCWRVLLNYGFWPLVSRFSGQPWLLILLAAVGILLALWEFCGLFAIFSRGLSPWQGLTTGVGRLLTCFHPANAGGLFRILLLLPVMVLGTLPILEQGIRSAILVSPLRGLAALALLLLLVCVLLAWPGLYQAPSLADWLQKGGSWKEALTRRRPLNPLAAFIIALLFALIQVGCCALIWAVSAHLYTNTTLSSTLVWFLLPVTRLLVCALPLTITTGVFAWGTLGTPKKISRSHPERFLALVCAGILCLCFSFPADGPADLQAAVKPVAVAHRGYADHVTENTIESFEKARQAGGQIVELDVYQNPEGILYISHDQNLNRVTGTSLDLETASSREIETLKTRDGQKIPTLEDTLAYAKDTGMDLMIEVKSTSKALDTAKKAAKMVREAGLGSQCFIAGFRHSTLEAVREVDPEIRTVMLLDFSLSDIELLEGVDIYSVEAGSITPDMIRQAHAAGKRIYAWTVNSRSQMDALLGMGVDGIVTDNIPEALKALQDFGLRQA